MVQNRESSASIINLGEESGLTTQVVLATQIETTELRAIAFSSVVFGWRPLAGRQN